MICAHESDSFKSKPQKNTDDLKSPSECLKKAIRLEGSGKYEEAVKLLEKGLEKWSENTLLDIYRSDLIRRIDTSKHEANDTEKKSI